LLEHWDGTQWSVVQGPSNGPDFYYKGIAAVSANDVWAVGSYVETGVGDRTFIGHWDGTQWTQVPSPNPDVTNNVLYAITAVSVSDIWAVGYYTYSGYYNTLTAHYTGQCATPTNTGTPPTSTTTPTRTITNTPT